jgi:leader peptidase (prepilin peptidase)/N-methyltransferase
MTLLCILCPTRYIPAYFIFFSALIVSIRSDIETMLISQYMTLFIIPVGIICSYLYLLPTTLWQSLAGASLGYLVLWSITKIFLWLTGKRGMGDGDFEVLALIGSFLGISGAWYSLMIASIAGSLWGLLMIRRGTADRSTKIPFGPFLAMAAIAFTFYTLYPSLLVVTTIRFL